MSEHLLDGTYFDLSPVLPVYDEHVAFGCVETASWTTPLIDSNIFRLPAINYRPSSFMPHT